MKLQDISYVRLGTRDLDSALEYATGILGLEVARRSAEAAYFRSDERDHTLCYFLGDPSDHATGFTVESATDLDEAASSLSNQGCVIQAGTSDEVERRQVRQMAWFLDPSGNRIELVHGAQSTGKRYFPARDVDITGFSHIGLRSTDPTRDENFWTNVGAARVSDRVGDAALLRIDDVHHKIALFKSSHPGIHHVNHQVKSIDDVMRSYYFLKGKGVRILFGPGRHATSGAVFLYFEGPDGMTYEYSTGVKLFSPEEDLHHKPRQFSADDQYSACVWGSVPDIPEFKSSRS